MPNFYSIIQTERSIAQLANHRQLIQLTGSLEWLMDNAQALTQNSQYVWIGEAPKNIIQSQYKQLLGQECELLIINAYQKFDANAFAAAEGALKGGGLLILLSSPHCNSHFDRYVQQQLNEQSFIVLNENTLLADTSTRRFTAIENASVKHPLNLKQQDDAIQAIIKTVTGHRRRPLVLTANRGRGKSAALGIAAKALIKSGIEKILICAPNKQASNTFFKHAGTTEHITFISPDLLLQTKPDCELLIIDEAAALPVPFLEAVAKHYSRLVFSTTLHGYEGSGRGFALRFQKILKQISPEYRTLHIDLPIRWAINDPLEAFTLNSLCLTEFNQAEPCYDKDQSVEFRQISQDELLQNKVLLQSIFSLLVTAHYQTKPSDLTLLLNDSDLSIFVLRQKNQLLGVALINLEGNIEPDLANEIFKGTRRIKGNLVPQSLAFHSGFKEACAHSFARIQRIAIYPSSQNNGLGHFFITQIKGWAKQQGFDHLSTAFGATEQLTRFWTDQCFSPLRIGTTKDKSSGTFSIIMNSPISDRGQNIHHEILMQFEIQFPFYLSRHLQSLDPLIAVLLLKTPSADDKYQPPALLQGYLSGNLQYQHIEFTLTQLLQRHKLSTLPTNQQKLYIQKVLQNQSWSKVTEQQGFTGKKQAQQALKMTIQQLIGNNNETR